MVPLLVFFAVISVSVEQDRRQGRTFPDEAIESPQRPGPTFSQQRETALEAWESADGFLTTINHHSEMPDRTVWKTPDRRDDGTPGIAPIARTRVLEGQRVLIINGPSNPDGVNMWKITDGETVGWISELQLDSVPK